MLIRKTHRARSEAASRGTVADQLAGQATGLDRRTFLRRSGLAGGALAALSTLSPGSVRKAEAAAAGPGTAGAVTKKNICTHCSVGCTVIGEVVNGVWVGQEPGWDSPISRGSHCAKGAATRELVHGDRRLRYPMKLVDGQWTRISWDVAINEIGDKLGQIRGKSGADSVYWLGSAKFTNEGSYLYRKFAAFWGTNNVDHQARICHSTTVAGVANTWGYGAMTNSYTDIRNSKTMIIMGGNPAEAHPVSLQHVLEGKEMQRANMIVIDPRRTRTAAHATEYVRIRSGTDIPMIWGMLWHIFKNGWEDKQFIEQRVYGMDDIRKEVEKYPPDVVEQITGVPPAQLGCSPNPTAPAGTFRRIVVRCPAGSAYVWAPAVSCSSRAPPRHTSVSVPGRSSQKRPPSVFASHGRRRGPTVGLPPSAASAGSGGPQSGNSSASRRGAPGTETIRATGGRSSSTRWSRKVNFA